MTNPDFPRLQRAVQSTALAVALAGGLCQAAAAAVDERDLPDTLRSGYVHPVIGPANDTAYARGALGIVRTSYGRASLYVAWRLTQLPPGAVASESHDRRGSWLHGSSVPRSGPDEKDAWLKARAALAPQAPAVAPDYFRQSKLKTPIGDTTEVLGQCGPDAFAFATRVLRDLVADASLTDEHRRSWIAAQDAVFARCTWTPGTTLPAAPAPLAAGAPAKLQALNAYQRAAAAFYADDFTAAREQFDAVAAASSHPMRPWAVLGAMRSLVRQAVRDTEWSNAVDQAWNQRGLRGDAFQAAVAEPAARRAARVDATIKELESRMKAALADPALAPVHGAVRYTMRRAVLQLAPVVPLRAAMEALDKPQNNPYVMGALDLFQETYPLVAPDRPQGELAAALRQRTWFDFIVTVQACTDVPKLQDDALCAREHTYAMARWTQTRQNTWLLAALMTARRQATEDLPAAEAARAVPADRPEWVSLQFYAARVFRAHGRTADARAALDALAASSALPPRDRQLLEAERRAL